MLGRLRLPALLAALAVALAAVGAAGGDTAHAQSPGVDEQPLGVDESLPPLADLSIVPDDSSHSSWGLTVTNNTVGRHPGATATRVKVRVVFGAVNGYRETRVWEIENLPPGGSVATGYRVPLFGDLHYPANAPTLIPMRLYAEIIESLPVEPPGFQHNNATESWRMADADYNFNNVLTGTYSGNYTNGDIGVEVASISDRFPQEGGATTFTVRAANRGSAPPGESCGRFRVGSPDGVSCIHTLFEVQVKFSLTQGLSFAADQQAPEGTTFDPATGIWDIGTVRAGSINDRSLPVAVNLAGSLEDVPLEERCLTAEVARAVPWFDLHRSKRENDTVTVCLGDDPPVLLTGGEIVLFYPYDCVGVTANPCTSEDTVEVVARANHYTIDLPGLDRSDSAGGLVWLQPESVIVQVPDPAGRLRDSLPTSITDRDTFTWHTGRAPGRNSINSGHHSVEGVEVGYSREGFNAQIADWSSFVRSVTVSGVDGAAAPGRVKVRVDNNTGFVFYDPNPTHRRNPFTLRTASTLVAPYFLEFSTLGTYIVEFTIEATRTDSTVYTDTEPYTFHVGPVAELEAKAAWVQPGVFTVTARNNGPDDAPAARVRVNLPQGMRFLRASASEGSYDPNSGVWDIGEMLPADLLRAAGLDARTTLTVYTEPTGEAVADPVTATIANHQDYCVRIKTGGTVNDDLDCRGSLPSGYTEHSIHYYDYVPGNNSVSLAARPTAPAVDAIRVTGMSVTSSPDTAKGYYLPGQDLEVETTFSDTVTAGAGAKLRLQVGRSLREATAVPSTGKAVRFRYRVHRDDRTDPGMPIRVTADPFVGPEAAIRASGGKTLSLLFPGKDLGSGHAIGPQPDRVYDMDAGEFVSIPAWSDPVFLTTGQEGSRYRFMDGMRHYYVYDSLTRRWMLDYRIAASDLSDDDLDLIQWLYLRASGSYDPHNGHPYGDDANPVAGKPYLGRWNDSEHRDNQVCWGLEAAFGPGKTRGQRLEELRDVRIERFSSGVDLDKYGRSQSLGLRSVLYNAKGIAPGACPDVPEGTQASPSPSGAVITGIEMHSMGPYSSAGNIIAVAMIYDREVNVLGAPQLAIEVGGEVRTAVYDATRSGPMSKVFRYTVRDEDRDSDGVSVYPGSIVLPSGASIRDTQGGAAWLSHDGLAAQQGHTVGPVTIGQMRGAPGVAAPPAVITGLAVRGSGAYGEGDAVSVAATFDWDVTVVGTPTLNIEVGGSPRAALYQPSLSDTAVKVFSYTVRAEDRDADGVSVYPGSITLPSGASIRDDQGTDADLTVAGLPPQPGHTVDGSQEGSSQDEAPAEDEQQQASASGPQTVAADWPLIPAGMGPGDSFRLLFVTSTTTNADSADIAVYNTFVQNAANANDSLKPFKDSFRALISTGSVNIKDNSATTGTGVPIHWLGGDKVADDYADLYDLSWDSVSGKTETGSAYAGLVWSGSNGRGETSLRSYAGAAQVRMADLGDAQPLSSPTTKASGESYPLYALSPVITVAAEVQQQQEANNEPQFALTGDTRGVDENAATGSNVGSPVTATDADGDALTYTLSGSNAFAIDASSGQITVQAALDYETQNSYSVTVSVTDGKDASGGVDDGVDDTIAVTVNVGNVDEAGTVTLNPETPQVGSPLTASLSDPDGGVSGETWAWQVSADGTSWTDIGDASGATYTPSAGDAGSYLRATASYADGHGSGKSAAAATTGVVEAAPAPAPTPQPPAITAGPVITSSPQSGDTYDQGEDIVVTMTFSEAVTVTGGPRVRMKIGERNRWARYARSEASGTRLVFAYTVKGSDRDEDGVSIEADQLWLDGGSITDADGNAAGLEHPALAAQSGHKVDGSLDEQPAQQQQQAQQTTAPTVPADSPLVPSGIEPGDSFRLLFVTSTTTAATAADIAAYNAFVQARAAANANLAGFSDQFRALISTESVNIKDNSATTGTGVPIHWLGGEQVADDYADLYDLSWDSVSAVTETGGAYAGLVWTGGNGRGETSLRSYAGAAQVRMGDLSDATLPLSSPTARAATESHPLYALSPIITVAQPE